MFNYIIRRIFQMVIVLFFSSAASYALLSLAPGGPLSFLTSVQARLNKEDIARIRAYFELDLFGPYRFTRWLIGQPRGPLTIAGQEYFADFVVGCRQPLEVQVQFSDGRTETRTAGCREGQDVTLMDLVDRPRSSRGVLFGDFGVSWQITRDRPVSDLVLSRLPRTLQLMLLSTFLAILIGVPLGVVSAVRQYSAFDYTVTSLAFFGSSMPTFFFGLLMILVFSITFKSWGWVYLPPGNALAIKDYVIPLLGKVEAGSFLDAALHLIMPTSVLVLFNVAGWSRFVRTSMLEVLRQDYVRTARAKGLLERVVIAKHALRNALIPFITIVVFSIPGAFGGAIITETVFNWPGMGRLYFDALGRTDYPVAMSLLLITAFLTVLATLLSDILYTVVDPRIRLS
ncbi:MAG: ABC transporter permease [Anaerolineales bacterium]|nr:ABC transporter permease [Anaerolineales bacterium]